MLDPNISMKSSVIITTKNRKDELRAAVRSTLQQTSTSEVIVIDDGSTDGTAQMIAVEFPSVILVRHESSRGLIVRRNEGALLASGEIIFSIDDDAVFSTPEVVMQAKLEFCDGRVGAVAIPFVEPHKENILMQKAPDQERLWITDRFIGTAHVLRRSLFLELGGYREHLIHQGEEGDYCIRMLNAGYYVKLGNSDPIHHFESPKRDFRRMDYYGPRNAILFAWQNLPWLVLVPHMVVTTLNVLRWTNNAQRFVQRFRAVFDGYRWISMNRNSRFPVSLNTYRKMRVLQRAKALEISYDNSNNCN